MNLAGIIRFVSPLDRKLIRDLWGMRGQVLAVSLVVGCGVALYVMMNGTLVSLQDTLDAYYSRYRMADVWAPARRAPLTVMDKLRAVPGVRVAEGRITAAALLDMAGEREPVKARIVSLPEGRQPRANAVYLKRGRLPERGSEQVLVADDFVEAYGLDVGDRIEVTLYGIRRELVISGVALAPEFIYSIAPGEMIPNPKRFAVMWMGYEALGHAYDMNGAFNEAIFLLERQASVSEVLRRVDIILEPYGGAGAYHRSDQLSDEFLQSEFDQLKTLGGLLPPIFLGVAAFLLNMVISRVVDQEREQIGLLKAFGYRSRDVVFHYLRFATAIVAIGVLAGWYAGNSMGQGMASLYRDFYKFPILLFDPGVGLYARAALYGVVAGVLGVLFAVRKTVRLRPAVAMAPPAPTDYSVIGGIGAYIHWMDQGLRLIVRHILRWPIRSLLTCLGVSMGMAIMIAAQGSKDAIDRMISMQFELVSRQDITVAFTEKRSPEVLNELRAEPGVIKVEPFLAVPATITHEHRSRHQGISGVMPGADLNIMLDRSDKPIEPAPKGVTLSESLAEVLDAKPGDMLQIEFRDGLRRHVSLPVARTVSTYLGTPAYMNMGELGAKTGEGDRISGAYIMADAAKLDLLYARLKDMPGVAAVSTNVSSYRAMKDTMDQTMGTMTFFNSLFASLIAIGVVFSSARISFYERQREIASLRVLGFTITEVNFVLLGELAILTFLALPLGAFLGYQLSLYMAVNLSSELFRVPTIVSNGTFAYAAMVIIVASLLSAAAIARQVAKLDLVIALKTRE
ncbi:ABC transporter permease [Kordiimonas sp.]|uniref:ABC transporter permease n=1 Tax=Kordiimonas sp. TaxID=1970157 RepID=UPI003A8F8313